MLDRFATAETLDDIGIGTLPSDLAIVHRLRITGPIQTGSPG